MRILTLILISSFSLICNAALIHVPRGWIDPALKIRMIPIVFTVDSAGTETKYPSFFGLELEGSLKSDHLVLADSFSSDRLILPIGSREKDSFVLQNAEEALAKFVMKATNLPDDWVLENSSVESQNGRISVKLEISKDQQSANILILLSSEPAKRFSIVNSIRHFGFISATGDDFSSAPYIVSHWPEQSQIPFCSRQVPLWFETSIENAIMRWNLGQKRLRLMYSGECKSNDAIEANENQISFNFNSSIRNASGLAMPLKIKGKGEIISCQISMEAGSGLGPSQPSLLKKLQTSFLKPFSIEDFDSFPTDVNTLKNRNEMVTSILTHELGHCLGLRHNFAGSSQPEDTLPSSSVMDYLPFDIVDNRDYWAEMTSVGKYDSEAIEWVYSKKIPKIPLRFCTEQDSYSPLLSRLLGRLFIAKEPYCFPYDALAHNLVFSLERIRDLISMEIDTNDVGSIALVSNISSLVVPVAFAYLKQSSSATEIANSLAVITLAFSPQMKSQLGKLSANYGDETYLHWLRYLDAQISQMDFCSLSEARRTSLIRIFNHFDSSSHAQRLKNKLSETTKAIQSCHKAGAAVILKHKLFDSDTSVRIWQGATTQSTRTNSKASRPVIARA